VDKFYLVPLIVTGRTFGKSEVVWAKLKELFQLRNDCVHPKPDRVSYLRVVNQHQFEPLSRMTYRQIRELCRRC
jgi:hypothetical protein